MHIQATGRWKEAEELEVQVMETRKQVLGPEHPDTLSSMANLAHSLNGLNKHQEAIALMEGCIKLCSERLGPNHPQTLSSIDTLNKWQAWNPLAGIRDVISETGAMFGRLFAPKQDA